MSAAQRADKFDNSDYASQQWAKLEAQEEATQRQAVKASSLRRQLEQSRGQKLVTVTIDGIDVKFEPASGRDQKDMIVSMASIEDGDVTAESIDAVLGGMWDTLATHSVDESLDCDFWSGYSIAETQGHIQSWLQGGLESGK